MSYGDEFFNLLQGATGGLGSVSGATGISGSGDKSPKGRYQPPPVDNYSSVVLNAQAREDQRVLDQTAKDYADANVKADRAAGVEYTASEANAARKAYREQFQNAPASQQETIKDIYNMDLSSVERGQLNIAKEDFDPDNQFLSPKEYIKFLTEQRKRIDERNQQDQIKEAVEDVLSNPEDLRDEAAQGVADLAQQNEEQGGGGDEDESLEDMIRRLIAEALAGFKCDCSHCSCEGGGS